MGSSIISQLARKYGAVIFFPTVTVGSIYADWSHTRLKSRITTFKMVLGLDKRAMWAALPLLGFAIGHFLDKKETERMSMFRDKSALYGRPAGSEDKPPSW
ncbi:hypothetical protein ACLKA7_006177 [Drosophila subpalustris]